MRFGVWKKLSGLGFTALLLASSSSFADWISVTNFNAVAINDGGGTIIPAKAAPYPSTNFISGLNGLAVAKMTVTLRGLTHSFPSDVSMLLVGPQGQRAVLMSEVGGQSAFPVSNLTFTLDDDAPAALPVYTTLTSGTFKPNNGYLSMHYTGLPYDFPAPAPVGNSNSAPALSVFKGADPNGTWKLYVVDDAGSNNGILSGGWTLSINTAVPLLVNRFQTNVVLSWTNAVAGCTLQCAPSLTGTWTNVSPAPVVLNGRYTVTNRLASGSAYYRLVK